MHYLNQVDEGILIPASFCDAEAQTKSTGEMLDRIEGELKPSTGEFSLSFLALISSMSPRSVWTPPIGSFILQLRRQAIQYFNPETE